MNRKNKMNNPVPVLCCYHSVDKQCWDKASILKKYFGETSHVWCSGYGTHSADPRCCGNLEDSLAKLATREVHSFKKEMNDIKDFLDAEWWATQRGEIE